MSDKVGSSVSIGPEEARILGVWVGYQQMHTFSSRTSYPGQPPNSRRSLVGWLIRKGAVITAAQDEGLRTALWNACPNLRKELELALAEELMVQGEPAEEPSRAKE